MISGAHFLLYSHDPAADRAFFRDTLGFRAVDAGGGWLILELPPAELAVHPASGEFVQTHAETDLLGVILYLMCDDLKATVDSLAAQGVACSEMGRAEWGLYTAVTLPSGGAIGLYQPTHATALRRR